MLCPSSTLNSAESSPIGRKLQAARTAPLPQKQFLNAAPILRHTCSCGSAFLSNSLWSLYPRGPFWVFQSSSIAIVLWVSLLSLGSALGTINFGLSFFCSHFRMWRYGEVLSWSLKRVPKLPETLTASRILRYPGSVITLTFDLLQLPQFGFKPVTCFPLPFPPLVVAGLQERQP